MGTDKSQLNKLNLLIFGFIAIVLGIILTSTLSNSTHEATDLLSTVNESHTFSHVINVVNSTTTLSNVADIVSFDALRNETSEDISTFCNVTLSTGVLNCNHTGSETCYADYTWGRDGYVSNSTARSLIRLIILFFALAVALIGVGIFNKIKEDLLG